MTVKQEMKVGLFFKGQKSLMFEGFFLRKHKGKLQSYSL